MPSLPQMLHEAVSRGAAEIIIESGQAPMIRTAAGAVSVGDPLSESELFDALTGVLGPEQQAELAVGNVVEFIQFVEGGRWTLLTEPAAEGIVVRGRLQGGGGNAPEVGRPLDLPALDPIEPPRRDRAPRTPGATVLRRGRSTQWDLGVASPSRGAVPTGGDALRGAGILPPASSTDDADWLIRGDGSGSDTLSSSEPEFELRTPTGEQPANLVDARLELEEDEERDTQETAESDAGADLPELISPPADDSLSRPMPVRMPAASVGTPRRPAPAARRDLSGESGLSDDVLIGYAGELGAGSLCIVAGRETARRLAPMHGETVVIVDAEGDGLGRQLAEAANANVSATYLVLLEDPSRVLAWLLRRLEEGARVVVSSRATTAAGARRSLLGIDAGARAEVWLDAHTARWMGPGSNGWSLHDL